MTDRQTDRQTRVADRRMDGQTGGLNDRQTDIYGMRTISWTLETAGCRLQTASFLGIRAEY